MFRKFLAFAGLIVTAGLLVHATIEGTPALVRYLDLDDCDDVAVDARGEIYLACHSTHGIGKTGASPLNMDAYVVKVHPGSGTVEYATRVGGSDVDAALQIVVDRRGNAFVTGITKSTDFPITAQAIQPFYAGGDLDAFLIKIAPDGKIAYSTYLGGSGTDEGHGLAFGPRGEVIVGGTTSSGDLLGSVSNQRFGPGGSEDLFMAIVDTETPRNSLTAIIGGTAEEKLTGIAATDRTLFVTGYTKSHDFPIMHPLQHALRGNSDAFVIKIKNNFQTIEFSLFLGGNGDDSAWGIGLAKDGSPVLTGITESRDFPVTNGAFQKDNAGAADAFISKLSPSGQQLLYSTYYGGSGTDNSGYDGKPLTVNTDGMIWIVGMTNSENLPMLNPTQPEYGGGELNGFVAAFSQTGKICYGSYAGGTARHFLEGIAAWNSNSVYATGSAIRPVESGSPQPNKDEKLGNFIVSLNIKEFQACK
jgi:hypothetical protein